MRHVFQQGTFAPDSDNRWMGSIAMDKVGNIAVNALGLMEKRRRNVRAALEKIIEKAGDVEVSATAVVSAVATLHGKRFTPCFHIFVAAWRWENEVKFRWPRLSAQYHKAWAASFPPDL
jgi:hypothetical protein